MHILVTRLDRDGVQIKNLEVEDGLSLEEVVAEAGWTLGNNQRLAVWNVLADPEKQAREGDRIEILPELTVDPMTARRLREEKNQKPENKLIHGRNGGKHRLL